MARTFAYARVSTTDQTTENQLMEIRAAGYIVEPHRIIAETVSGSVCAELRKGFSKLIERMERGDELIVTKLDRLGRNAIDVASTVERLAANGIAVVCLQLGKMDLTSAAGKMTMGVLVVVAQFERDLLIERTHAGLARARKEGKTLGRKPILSPAQREQVLTSLHAGLSVASIAKAFATSRQNIMRVRDAANEHQ